MAKMKFTSPSTDAQKAYFARSANMRFWAGLLVIVAPFIWAVADFVGLSGYIMPEHRVLSYGGTGLFLLFAHGLLIASALMVGYDMFDNNKVEGKVFAVLPILLTAGLLWFSWIGMEKIYLTQFAHKANIVSTEQLESNKNTDLKIHREEVEASVKQIKEPFELKITAKKQAAKSEIDKIKRRIDYDDADRRKKKNDIQKVESRLSGEIAAITEAESEAITEANKSISTYTNAVNFFHQRDLAAISEQNEYERKQELKDKQGANMKSFWFSICMAVLFWVSVLTRTRLDCKSGIIPTFEHTDGDKSDKVRETLFVINAILGSRYSRFLSRLHDNLAVEYETVTPKNKKTIKDSFIPPTNGGDTGDGGGDSTPPKDTTPPAPEQPYNGGNKLMKSIKYLDNGYGFLRADILDHPAQKTISDIISDDEYLAWRDALRDINPVIHLFDDNTYKFDTKDLEKVCQLALSYAKANTPTPSVELVDTAAKPVITDITSVITDLETKKDNSLDIIIKAFRKEIEELNSDCRNFETQNGTAERIVDRIAIKLLNCYNIYNEHQNDLPAPLIKNFTKAYNRGRTILEAYKEGLGK